MRVEQALRFLPDLEALMPLRSLLVASARPDERLQWGSGEPYLTVGKRALDPAAVAGRTAELLARIHDHIAALYRAYVEALERQEAGDIGGVVGALAAAGGLERKAGRLEQARAWYVSALAVAEGAQDRRPEIETLLALGGVCLALGDYANAGRRYQRALALAEAEFDQAGGIDASLGLGAVALELGEWSGAQAWFARAHRLVAASPDIVRRARVERHLGVLAQHQSDWAAAGTHFRAARDELESLPGGPPAEDMTRVLDAQGQLDAALGRYAAATAAFREALAWVRRERLDGALDAAVRLHLAQSQVEGGRWLEAEEEMRRAEQAAVGTGRTASLAEIYLLLGDLRGRQGDETGFVFFEQAIDLCRATHGSPVALARAYHEYSLFRRRFGDNDEAHAYLEQARDLFESVGVRTAVEKVQAELRTLSA